MHHMGMKILKTLHEKFEIKKEVKGDTLTITFKGDEKSIEKLNKKIDAIHTLSDGCCEEGTCC